MAREAVKLGKRSLMAEYISRACFMLGLVQQRRGRVMAGRKLIEQGLRLAWNIKGVLVELAYCSARHQGGRPMTSREKKDMSWAHGVYRRLGNSRRARVLKEALAKA